MALINCKECNKEISDSVDVCPNCGFDRTQGNRDKRKRNNKIGCLILLIFLGFFIYKCSNTDILADEKARTAKIEKEHCGVDWSKIDKSQKEKVLAEYINVSRFMKNSPDDVAVRLVRESVKYPGTLSDITPFGEIADVEKGIIEYSGSFTSENKLSMKVKGSYNFKIKYTAGCKPYEYVSFDIN